MVYYRPCSSQVYIVGDPGHVEVAHPAGPGQLRYVVGQADLRVPGQQGHPCADSQVPDLPNREK